MCKQGIIGGLLVVFNLAYNDTICVFEGTPSVSNLCCCYYCQHDQCGHVPV